MGTSVHTVGDVDEGERHFVNLPVSFWGTDGKPRNLASADDAIFVVILMENDDGDPEITRNLIKGASVVSLVSNLSMPHATRVSRLIRDISSALRVPTGFPNFDDEYSCYAVVAAAGRLGH